MRSSMPIGAIVNIDIYPLPDRSSTLREVLVQKCKADLQLLPATKG